MTALLCAALTACSCGQITEDTVVSEVDVSDKETETDDSEEDEPEEDDAAGIVLEDCIVELSGRAEDTFTAEYDCYTDSDAVILFFAKGVTVKGDMLKITEKIMSDLSRQSGLDFKKKHNFEPLNLFDMYYENTEFPKIDPGNKKVHIYIVPPDTEMYNWAFDGGIVVSTDSYDFDETKHQVLYHELSHVLHTRNGVSLTPLMNEGYAVFMSYHTMRACGIPSEETRQYFCSPEYPTGRFDDSIIGLGEEGFMIPYGRRVDTYHYGFRLITFLNEVYGEDAFVDILDAATDEGFDEGYSDENEKEDIRQDQLEMIEIIKSETDDDVFDKFAEWYELNWEDRYEDYLDYMAAADAED